MSAIFTDHHSHNNHCHDDDHNHDHGHSHDHHHMPSISTNGSSDVAAAAATTTTTKTSPPFRSSSRRSVNRTSSYLDHRHDNTPEMIQQQRVIRKLQIAVGIICFFLLIEMIGGYMAKSLAIWSDAAHLMADLAAIMVALLAAHLGTFPVSDKHTFGLKRVESLAALFSTMSLLCISIGLAYEAIIRIYNITTLATNEPDGSTTAFSSSAHQVDGRLMSIIAFIGVLVNLTLAYVLGEHHVHLPSDDGCHHGHSHDHDHHSDHPQEHATATSTSNKTAATTTKSSSHTGCSGENHNHSHDHHHSNEKDDDHHGHSHDHATTTDAVIDTSHAQESTPLLQAVTTNSTHYNHQDNTTSIVSKEHHEPKSTWKMPFSPQNINLQAAYLHVLGDLAQSATVFIAGCIIWVVPSFTIIDPICTLLFCVLVFYSAYSVCRTSIAVLLQQVPSHLNYHSIRDKIASVQNVHDVHDLHIWSISHRVPALTVHVSITYPSSDGNNTVNYEKPIHDEVLENIYKIVRCEFDIIHATIQIQSTNGDCVTCVDRLCRPCLLEGDDMMYHDVPVDGDDKDTTSTIV